MNLAEVVRHNEQGGAVTMIGQLARPAQDKGA
jgi:hypothetical protein